MNKAKRELIEDAIKSSDQHLKTAKFTLGIKSFNDSVSISYYALLDITRAVLIYAEIFPKSHSGTIHKFNEKFIKTEIFPKKFGRMLSEIEKDRIEADYNFKKRFTAEEAKEIFGNAQEFTTVVKKYLKENIK